MATLTLRSTRRQKFTIGTLIQAAALALALQWPWHGLAVLPLVAISYLIVAWVLDFDLRKEEWLVVPLYMLVATATAFFVFGWYLNTPWIQWGGVMAYGLVCYGLLLTLNILNVATVRPLPLIRQALSVVSLAGIAGLFSVLYLLLTLLPNIVEWVVGSAIIAFVFAWPLVWSAKLGQAKPISWQAEVGWAALVALIAGQLAAITAFWPVSFMTSLLMAAGISMALGLIHYQQNRQVTKGIQLQYLSIAALLMVGYYVISQWT